jgi:hypothetical protein
MVRRSPYDPSYPVASCRRQLANHVVANYGVSVGCWIGGVLSKSVVAQIGIHMHLDAV